MTPHTTRKTREREIISKQNFFVILLKHIVDIVNTHIRAIFHFSNTNCVKGKPKTAIKFVIKK